MTASKFINSKREVVEWRKDKRKRRQQRRMIRICDMEKKNPEKYWLNWNLQNLLKWWRDHYTVFLTLLIRTLHSIHSWYVTRVICVDRWGSKAKESGTSSWDGSRWRWWNADQFRKSESREGAIDEDLDKKNILRDEKYLLQDMEMEWKISEWRTILRVNCVTVIFQLSSPDLLSERKWMRSRNRTGTKKKGME